MMLWCLSLISINTLSVLELFTGASFKLKASKCHSKSEIKYLGHIVSKQGIQTDPDKVSAVLEFPVPTTIEAICWPFQILQQVHQGLL